MHRNTVVRVHSQRQKVQLQHGFTLLELLIAVSLLTLVMLGLGSSMLTVSQTQTRVDARLMQMDLQRTHGAFLRSILGKISNSTDTESAVQVQGRPSKFFQGDAQSMQWLGVMPARFGAAGRTFFRLGLQPSNVGGGTDLVLWFQPWNGEKSWTDFSQATAYVLATNVTGLNIAYQNPLTPNAPWASNWPASADLPSAVDIAVATEQGVWSKTMIALYETTSRSSGGAVFGGTVE